MDIQFANKEYLFLLLLIIPYILWYVMYRKKSEPTIRMADTKAFRNVSRSWRLMLMPIQPVLRIAAFTLLVLALARPQNHNAWQEETIEGIDIMMAIDISSSMLGMDMDPYPNRIEAAKQVAAEFISDRTTDNIGLTIFAGEAFTLCPMTIDHSALLAQLQHADDYMQNILDATAIGMGLTNAVSRLKDSKAKSRVIILLTDGSNNYGEISPLTAADIAKEHNIRVYTIAVGAKGMVRYPQMVGGTMQYIQLPNEIDETTLKQIAQKTDGIYYRATNAQELKHIYDDIDKLEKSKLNVQRFQKVSEGYQPFAMGAILALLLELLLRTTIFRRIP